MSFFSSVLEENLFHGQIERQSSHPYTLFPIFFRKLSGKGPLCSIVKYDMHFLASITFSLSIASVGQTFIQSSQLPQ